MTSHMGGSGMMGLERLLQQAREMTDRAENFRRQKAELRPRGESPDGLVTVTLDGEMKVTSVEINPRALRLDSQALAESVQAAIDAAYAAYAEATAELMAEMVGDEDLARGAVDGSLTPDDVFRRFGVDLDDIRYRTQ